MSGRLYIGIDGGSSATKCVVLDAGGALLGHSVVPSGFDYAEASERARHEALAAAHSGEDDVASCVATGYGRSRIGAPAGATSMQRTEITCHARGAREWYSDVRHVIDIGGQDTKVIRLCDRGRMADYRMNAKCAAGTGTFLESIAVRLGVPLGDIDAFAMQSTARLSLNSYCTVFTSTEVLERIKDGEPKEDIAMGLFRAIASRVVEMMSTGGRDGSVAATGGVVTHCRAMVRALEEALDAPVHLPPLPQHAGAYGAALLARETAGCRLSPDGCRPAGGANETRVESGEPMAVREEGRC
jgi:(R)-2-hydroxyacyl-CoA dehydratese activating ATPase